MTLEVAIINGDKMMQIANDYEKEVFNGAVGTIDAIDSDNSELSVLFPSSEAGAAGSRAVIYGWGELDTLVPAYACNAPQEPGQRVSRRGDPAAHPRQAAGGAGGPEESPGDGRQEPPGPQALHQAGGVAQLTITPAKLITTGG